MSVKGVAAFAAAAVFWAACLVGLDLAAGTLGVALTVGLIGLCGSLALFVQAFLVQRTLTWRINWTSVVIWAALGAGIVWATTFAVSWAGVAVGALTVSSIPLFDTVVGQMRGKAPATGLGAVSLLLGIGGLALVVAFPAGNVDWTFAGGAFAGLLAAIAVGSCGRQFTERLHHRAVVESAIASSAIGGLGSLLLIPVAPPINVSANGIVAALAIAVGGAFLMLFAMSHAADAVPRRPLAILPGVGTVLSVIAGWALLGESLSVPQALGLVLILAGTGLLLGLVPRWFPASWRA
jgi:probable blue pigment (indigoidine) exporter